MDLSRTQFGLIFLLAGAVFMLVTLTLALLNPEAVRGAAAGGEAGLSTALIATTCLTGLMFLAILAGLGTVLSDSRNYSQAHFIASLAALILFVASVGVPIVANLGGGSFARTGDNDAYQRALLFSMVSVVLTALALPLAAWHLFKPGWRALPVITAIGRAVAGIGELQTTRLHTTLMARTFGDQTVYMPRYDVPLTSGPIFNWQIAGWAGVVLLAGMFAVLLFGEEDAMQPRPEDTRKRRPSPEPVES